MLLRCERLNVSCTIGQYTQGCRGDTCREAARVYKQRYGAANRVPIDFVDDPQPAWRNDAACRSADPGGFFPHHGQVPHVVKELCGTCPVRQNCLDFAIRNRVVDGWWGGMSPKARRKIQRVAA